MTEPLVRVRCGKGKCRQVMLEVYAGADYDARLAEAKAAGNFPAIRLMARRPDDLSGSVQLVPCPRHDSYRGGFPGEVLRRHGKGLDPRPVVNLPSLRWADMAHTLYLATTRQRCEDVTLTR